MWNMFREVELHALVMGIIYCIEGIVEYIDVEGASCPGHGELYIVLKVM
jgi:hypothetical protein